MDNAIKVMDKLKNEWKGDTRAFIKYFDVEEHYSRKNTVYDWLDIPKNSNCLDISAGFGYFSYICQSNGHTVVLTDVIDDIMSLSIEARKRLGLPDATHFAYCQEHITLNTKAKKHHSVYKDLPEFYEPFDLITAFASVPMSYFSVENWEKFVVNALEQIKYNGMLYIEPNSGVGKDNLFSMVEHYKHKMRTDRGVLITKESRNG